MPTSLTLTAGDTAPTLTGYVASGRDRTSLVGANVVAHLKRGTSGPVLTKPVTITDPDAGEWAMPWADGDLAGSLLYLELQVTYSDGTVQTFGPQTIRVRAQIA